MQELKKQISCLTGTEPFPHYLSDLFRRLQGLRPYQLVKVETLGICYLNYCDILSEIREPMGKAGNNYSSQETTLRICSCGISVPQNSYPWPKTERDFSNFFEEYLKYCHPGLCYAAPGKAGHHLLKAVVHERAREEEMTHNDPITVLHHLWHSVLAYGWPGRRMRQAGLSLGRGVDRKKNAVMSWCVWRADNSDRRQFLQMVSIYWIHFSQCLLFSVDRAQGVQYWCEEQEGDCWSRKLTTCWPASARHREQVQMHTFLQRT